MQVHWNFNFQVVRKLVHKFSVLVKILIPEIVLYWLFHPDEQVWGEFELLKHLVQQFYLFIEDWVLRIVSFNDWCQCSLSNWKTNNAADHEKNGEDFLWWSTYTDVTIPHSGKSRHCEIKAGEVNMLGIINPWSFIIISLYLSNYHPDTAHDVAKEEEWTQKHYETLQTLGYAYIFE